MRLPPPPLTVQATLFFFVRYYFEQTKHIFVQLHLADRERERGWRGGRWSHLVGVQLPVCVCVWAHFNSRFDDHNGNSFNDRTCDDADNDDARGAAETESEGDSQMTRVRERDTSARAPQGNLNCGQTSCCSCSSCCCFWLVLNGWAWPCRVQTATLHFLLA